MQSGLESAKELPTSGRTVQVKIGKVVSVHRDGHLVDIMFLDGNVSRKLPVLSGWMTTTSGFAHMTAPTYDSKLKARKTYPEASGGMVQPPWNEGGMGRDTYAVVIQSEGHGFGVGHGFVIGFLAPEVSEMMFAAGEGNEFSDLALMRHPSDLQTTIDHTGKMSIQLPNCTRITIGNKKTNVKEVDLTGKDYDKLYKLRNNLKELSSMIAEVVVKIAQGAIAKGTKAFIYLSYFGDMEQWMKNNLFIHNHPAHPPKVHDPPRPGDGECRIVFNEDLQWGGYGPAFLEIASAVTVRVTAPTIRLDADQVLVNGEVLLNGTTEFPPASVGASVAAPPIRPAPELCGGIEADS